MSPFSADLDIGMMDFIENFWYESDRLPDFATIGRAFGQPPFWAKTLVVHLVARKYLQWRPGFDPPYEVYNPSGGDLSGLRHQAFNPRSFWRDLSVNDYLTLFPDVDRHDTENRLHHCLSCGRLIPEEGRAGLYLIRWFDIGPYCGACHAAPVGS